jgi:hypothetical protein
MLTGTAFEAFAILALIAVVHAFVSSFIAARLSAGEKAAGEKAAGEKVGIKGVSGAATANFHRIPANDQVRNAA